MLPFKYLFKNNQKVFSKKTIITAIIFSINKNIIHHKNKIKIFHALIRMINHKIVYVLIT